MSTYYEKIFDDFIFNYKGGEKVQIEKLDICPKKNPYLDVKVTEMGNVIEIQYMTRRNNKATIRMLEGGYQYVKLSTGEIKDVVHHETRADQKKSLYRTFRNARGLINANVTDVNKARWITLTYEENMTDTVRLYTDFDKFNKRFQYYCQRQGYGKAEYIVMMEPQGRGAWHAHLLYIFKGKAPFIPNDTLNEIWGHGYVRIKKLDDVDNVGAYLTAYLGDMDLDEAIDQDTCFSGDKIKVVELEEDGIKKKKYFVKGARLNLYPANFNMIRSSRGVLRPTEEIMTQLEAQKKVLGATKTYEKTVRLCDDSTEFECIINTVQYNTKRKPVQDCDV